jgi:hypothetical protein
MSDEPMTPALHSEEQLAAYVEGSSSAEERAPVEEHLISCTRCRSDVRYAQAAREALRGLPMLEAPGIAAALRLPEGEPTGGAVVSLDARRSRVRWQRVTAALGAAAAASVVAAALVLHLGGGAAKSSSSSGGAQPRIAQDAISGPDYTAQSLAALARQLQSDEVFFGAADASVPTPSPAPAALPAIRSARNGEIGSSCLRGAAGLPSDATLSFFRVGSFEGKPAYIGAFRTGTGTDARLVVVAAARDGCRAFDVISARL